MVAPFTVEGDSFRTEKPRLWSDGRFFPRGPNRMFDVHPKGERFVLAASAPPPQGPGRVTFIFNFSDELRRISPIAPR